MSVFGNVINGADVEAAVIEHLRTWMPTYLAEAERSTERDPETLPMVRSWTSTPRVPEKWPEDQLPAVLCVSSGLIGEPKMKGDGSYHATWSIGLAVICSARTQEETNAFAKLYFAALRSIMVQHPGIGGLAESAAWMSEDYDSLPVESRRTMASGYGVFAVEVSDVVNARAGLAEPPEDPYDVDDQPTIQSIDQEVEPA